MLKIYPKITHLHILGTSNALCAICILFCVVCIMLLKFIPFSVNCVKAGWELIASWRILLLAHILVAVGPVSHRFLYDLTVQICTVHVYGYCCWKSMNIFIILLIPWNRVILEELIVAVLVKLNFYDTQRFITVFPEAHTKTLCWAGWIQSTPLHFIC